MKPRSLLVEVCQIKGHCPVYQLEDRFQIREGYKLVSSIPVCMHALASIMPYYVALSRGISPRELGLAWEESVAYVQCLDRCGITGGGTVVFRLTPREERPS